jgi:hypothetical protein
MTWSVPIAIVIGAALIASVIAVTFRWELHIITNPNTIIRLDRWTGQVAGCRREELNKAVVCD